MYYSRMSRLHPSVGYERLMQVFFMQEQKHEQYGKHLAKVHLIQAEFPTDLLVVHLSLPHQGGQPPSAHTHRIK